MKKKILIFILFLSFFFFMFIKDRPFSQEGRFIRIPIQYDTSERASVFKANIEGSDYFLKFDWGLPGAWTLQSQVLEKVQNKKLVGSVQYRDFKGNPYSSPAFQIPLIKMSQFKVENSLGIQEQEDFVRKGCVVWTSSAHSANDYIVGKVGRDMFRNWNLIFDFPQNSLYLTHWEAPEFGKRKFRGLKKIAETPFKKSRNGTVISIETDLGIKRFLLDTGATHSFFRRSLIKEENTQNLEDGELYYISDKFLVRGSDLGRMNLILIEWTQHMDDVDGILGVDFFKQHPIYLDFQNDKAVIF